MCSKFEHFFHSMAFPATSNLLSQNIFVNKSWLLKFILQLIALYRIPLVNGVEIYGTK